MPIYEYVCPKCKGVGADVMRGDTAGECQIYLDRQKQGALGHQLSRSLGDTMSSGLHSDEQRR